MTATVATKQRPEVPDITHLTPVTRTAHICRLTPMQEKQLLRPIDQSRVMNRQGIAYVAGWDDRRWMNRIFGIAGWSEQHLDTTLVEKNTFQGKGRGARGEEVAMTRHSVIYSATVRVTVKCADCGAQMASFDGSGVDGKTNQPDLAAAHHTAMTSAQTLAFKRAVMNLGDQFGLSLYNKGQTRPSVDILLPYEERRRRAAAAATDGEQAPVQREPEFTDPAVVGETDEMTERTVDHDAEPVPVPVAEPAPAGSVARLRAIVASVPATVTKPTPPATEWERSYAALEGAADAAGIPWPEVERVFKMWQGVPLDQGTAAQLDTMYENITGGASA